MARLLIHNVAPPLHPTDDVLNAGMFQIGHVVTIIEDGENFGTADEGGHTIVFEATGTPKSDLEYLVSDETIQVERIFIDPDTKEEIKKFETVAVAARMWKAKDVSQLKMVSGLTQITKGAEVSFTNSYFDKTVDVAAIVVARRAKGEVVK